jgi:pimeloyl-ACP methyl ester carboxylesterase
MASRFQEETVLRENLMLARPWGFELAQVRVPVGVWQGEKDVGCTAAMARHLEAGIPSCRCTIAEGKGHMLWFDDSVLEEVLQWLSS